MAETPQNLKPPYKLVGHELATPLFNAAGAINHPGIEAIIGDAKRLAKTGVGAIQYGSGTIPVSVGNEAIYGAPIDYYDEETGKMTNSKGLPNPGEEVFLKYSDELVGIAHESGKLAIMSVSPTKGAGDSVEQAVRLSEKFLDTKFDLVIANVSCPNVFEEGEEEVVAAKPIMGYDYEAMDRFVETLWERVGQTDRLGVKSANHDTEERKIVVPQLAGLYRKRPVFAWMEEPNTIPGYIPKDKEGNEILTVPGGAGGLSGPATVENGREQLAMWHEHIGGFMDIVSTQGVHDGHELAWRVGHGAVAGSGVHFLWNSKKKWGPTVDEMIEEFSTHIDGE